MNNNNKIKILQLYNLGYTSPDIAKKLNVSVYTILRNLKYLGVNKFFHKSIVPIANIIKLRGDGLSYNAIAKKFRCSVTSIKNRLKTYAES